MKLKFKSLPKSTHLELGETKRIYCIVQGEPPIKIKWVKLGVQKLDPHVQQEKDGSLYFKTVRYSDAGKYSCQASNDRDQINVTIELQVGGKLK